MQTNHIQFCIVLEASSLLSKPAEGMPVILPEVPRQTPQFIHIKGSFVRVEPFYCFACDPKTWKKEANLSPDAFPAKPPSFDTISLGDRPTLPESLSFASSSSNRG